MCSYFDRIKYKKNLFTRILFQQSSSEVGDGGLLSECWGFWVVLILFCRLFFICLFAFMSCCLVLFGFCGYLVCCFVRLCLQGQYCSSCS